MSCWLHLNLCRGNSHVCRGNGIRLEKSNTNIRMCARLWVNVFADYDHVIALQPTHNVNCQRMSNNLNLLTEKKFHLYRDFKMNSKIRTKNELSLNRCGTKQKSSMGAISFSETSILHSTFDDRIDFWFALELLSIQIRIIMIANTCAAPIVWCYDELFSALSQPFELTLICFLHFDRNAKL